jgi:hypothetical protein
MNPRGRRVGAISKTNSNNNSEAIPMQWGVNDIRGANGGSNVVDRTVSLLSLEVAHQDDLEWKSSQSYK